MEGVSPLSLAAASRNGMVCAAGGGWSSVSCSAPGVWGGEVPCPGCQKPRLRAWRVQLRDIAFHK